MPKYTAFSFLKAVIRLFLQGCKQIQISRVMGVQKSSVSLDVRHFKPTGKIVRKTIPGRPPKVGRRSGLGHPASPEFVLE